MTRDQARAAYDHHRRFCRRSASYCRTCRSLRAEAFPEPPIAREPASPPTAAPAPAGDDKPTD